jgi:hypothetical protein
VVQLVGVLLELDILVGRPVGDDLDFDCELLDVLHRVRAQHHHADHQNNGEGDAEEVQERDVGKRRSARALLRTHLQIFLN